MVKWLLTSDGGEYAVHDAGTRHGNDLCDLRRNADNRENIRIVLRAHEPGAESVLLPGDLLHLGIEEPLPEGLGLRF